ncbi:MAG: isoprenyl transferase [Candidatus Marinimicrobia bacterium]|nr:isoprenyl transferase [Candidatus Neomarinimicrobiota bacterium]|tara:strand:- start:3501 stop:4253 length:753 start_codon:yes stop_codon:yes gene_type:complete
MPKSLRDKVLEGSIPDHVAIIMDGNGRWASDRSLPRIAGHREGINSVREITRVCGEIGIKHLTLYTFSTENWRRPPSEVKALMSLLLKTINIEIRQLHKNNVKFTIIGELESLPIPTVKGLKNGVTLTSKNSGLNLCLALNYGSRKEILDAVKSTILKVQKKELEIDQVDETFFSKQLYTKNIPDPDLLIRTSGEYRLSNFLLWQSAYTEIYLTDAYWPSFRSQQLFESINDYQNRERRFGKVSNQIKDL